MLTKSPLVEVVPAVVAQPYQPYSRTCPPAGNPPVGAGERDGTLQIGKGMLLVTDNNGASQWLLVTAYRYNVTLHPGDAAGQASVSFTLILGDVSTAALYNVQWGAPSSVRVPKSLWSQAV